MNRKDILDLLDYCGWARERLVGSLQQIKDEDFSRDLHSSHGGIRGTLSHMITAENTWLARLRGKGLEGFEESKLATLQGAADVWKRLDEDFRSCVADMSEEELQADISYSNTSGRTFTHPKIWAIHHLANHFSYHRGQVVAMQRMMGYRPANTDLIGYYREKQK